MNCSRRSFMFLLSAAALTPLAGCASSAASSSSSSSAASSSSTTASPTGTLAIDSAKWNYDSDNDVYWQIGLSYCTQPQASDYESYGIYVPGAYFSGKKNSDGMYTCTVNKGGTVGDYTAATAPIVFPINGAGYSAQAAPTQYSYSGLSSYMKAGFVYVYAGMRGRNNGYDQNGKLTYPGGAPWGVTDAKAAIRTIRYNAANLPGNAEHVFTFGMSGGGALSSLLGATGDSALYTPYLQAIGAPLKDSAGADISDTVFGSMCWCPITSLDVADEAYEWMMGQYAETGTRADGTFTAALSSDMAESFATIINKMGLQDKNGTALTLAESTSGIYTSGTYYDCILATIEESLNNFLSDTTFPYSPGASQTNADGGFGGGDSGTSGGMMGGGTRPSGTMPSDAQGASSGSAPTGAAPTGDSSSSSAASGVGRGMMGMTGTSTTTDTSTYDTAQAYIDSLNGSSAWITYDATTNTAKVSSVGAFVKACKTPTKDVGAFDSFTRSQAENYVFGNNDSDALHFDAYLSDLLAKNQAAYAELSNWDSSYPSAYAGDLAKTDSLGNDIAYRAKAYNPMYYACKAYEGYGTSNIAKHWRIHTGINQGDTSLTTEKNLALALQANPNVKDVEFATVWGKAHTMAERTGDSTSNFITWVAGCCK